MSTTRSLVLPVRFCTLSLALIVASCGGTTPERRVTATTSETVTASGATLLGPDGTELSIPAGAVSGSVTIVASALTGVRAPAGTAAVAEAVRLGPAGTTFDKPVELTIPISPSSLPSGATIDDVVVVRSAQDSSVFVPLPTRRHASGSAVVAATEHFSDFVAVVVTAGATPFGACGDAMCMGGETCGTCPLDCGVCVAAGNCGNGSCESAAGESCDVCAFDCGPCAAGVCGDGTIDSGESCDDGNAVSNDGCNSTCTTVEAGYACPISSIPCYLGACGDGTLQGPEACDDGNATSSDGCDYACLAVETHYQCPIVGMSCSPICGDGVGIAPEPCDDGNATSGDGCSATCALEAGFTCPPSGGPCTVNAPVCGDFSVTGAETCDEGPSLNGQYGHCNATCDGPGPYCGDGIPQMPQEVCDDGVGGPCAADCQSSIPVPNGMLHIFETSVFTGNLGGNAGADALCMGSPNRPNSGTFKALLVDSTRHICTSPYCASGVAALDWVLSPSTTYYRGAQGSETSFMTTDANGIVTSFPLGSTLGSGTNFWLGMSADWQASANNCLDFTDGTSNFSSPVGWDAVNGSGFFAGGSYMCDSLAKIVCVEQ